VSENRSTGLVSGLTVVEQNRATQKCCCRSIRSALLCGSNVPNLQDLVRIAVEFSCYFWDIDRYTICSVDRLFKYDIDRRALVKLYVQVE
uniref:Uncharacterized protein n=1 Tax=Brassica oleracea var. oleracea TaxID=109376 RepID=A0A0D3CFR9_BRAOL